jgi:hypothetical protein
MLMRPKHSLVRLQALNMSGDLVGSFTHRSWCKIKSPGDVRAPSVLAGHELFIPSLRPQGFQVRAEFPLQDRMIIVIL